MTQFLCLILIPQNNDDAPEPLRSNRPRWTARSEIAKRYLKLRALRDTIDGGRVLSDPAWDMLLDLFVANVDGKKISVSSACIASRRPATTSLRYLAQMVEIGLIRREKDDSDNRRVFLCLTDRAFPALAEWLDALQEQLATI